MSKCTKFIRAVEHYVCFTFSTYLITDGTPHNHIAHNQNLKLEKCGKSIFFLIVSYCTSHVIRHVIFFF